MEDPVVPLDRHLYGHPLAGLLWERQREKNYWSTVGKSSILGMLIRASSKRINLICACGRHQIGWKERNINPMWKVLNKEVELGEPISFLDHVYLGCIQRHCETRKHIVDNYRTMFESRISAGATEKLPSSETPNISTWSYGMEGHAKKCVEQYFELANKTTEQLYKVSTPCIDDHKFKEQELRSEVNCLKYVHKLFSNVYICHEQVDWIFCDQSTNLHVRSQNGPEPVTDVWRV